MLVSKQNNEIRLFVDMRRANEAIISLNQSTVVSKLDLKQGYHHLELHLHSRSVTNFITHCGLFQYKRLMFGISSAPDVCISRLFSKRLVTVRELQISQMT